MLENMGATVAINDMLFQSHGGALRFFPVWDAQALGAASFGTLRGYGAFLASGAIDADGNISPITLFSEQVRPKEENKKKTKKKKKQKKKMIISKRIW
jgi:hypothetical protein